MTPEAYAAVVRRAGQEHNWQELRLVTQAHAWAVFRATLPPAARAAWRRAVALGPLLPLLTMAFGLAFQGVAALVFQAIPLILVLTLACGLLGMPVLSMRAAFGPTSLAVTLSLGTLAPCAGWALAAALGAGGEERAWVALAAAAPVGSAALGGALALGFSGVLTAGTVLASLLATPLMLPAAAWFLGTEAGIAPGALALRLALLAGVPALLAAAFRRSPTCARPGSRRRFAEVALIALALLALARMHGVRETAAADPAAALGLLGLAMIPTVAGALAVLLVLRTGAGAGAEALFAGGFRNVALVWAAVAHMLPPNGNLFMALTALPIYAMPALVHLAMRLRASQMMSART